MINLKRELLLIIILAFASLLHANNTIDSLENILNNPELTSIQAADTKLELIKALKFRGAKADSLIDHTIAFTQKNELLYQEAKAKYYQTIFWVVIRKIDDNYLVVTNEIDSIAKLLEDPQDLPISYGRSMSYYYWWNKQYEKAVKLLKKTLIYTKENNLQENHDVKLLGQLAHVLGLNNQFFEAIKIYEIALNLPKANKSLLYGNITNLYRRLEDWEKVMVYADTALTIGKEEKNFNVFSVMVVGKAEALNHLDRFEEAESVLKTAYIDVCKATSSRRELYFAKLLRSYIGMGEFDKGLMIEDSLPTLEKRYPAYGMVVALLGSIYLEKKKTSRAIELCEEAKAHTLAKKSVNYLAEACDCLHKAYGMTNQYEKAYENFLMYNDSKTKINEREQIMNLSRALNQQDLQQQEEVLLLQQQEQEYKHQQRISRFKLASGFGLALIGLALFTIFQIRKRSQQINTQNKIISEALKEKEILLKEIHHRVKNNLQVVSGLLKWQSSHIKDEMALDAINEGQTRVQSMAIIHQKLYQSDNLTGINMDDYIQRLSESLFYSYNIKPDAIHLETKIEAVNLDIDTVIPLGLILNELISNALKHAFNEQEEGRLLVELRLDKAKENLLLRVKDSGTGMPDKTPVSSDSFGWELIETLTEKLEGKLIIDNTDGTDIQLVINNFKLA